MYRTFFMTVLLASVAVIPAANAQLNKHDSSIASHGYNIAIQENVSVGGAGNLAQDIDKGIVNEDAPRAASAPNSFAPAPQAVAPQAALVSPQQVIQAGAAAPEFVLPTTDGAAIGLKNLVAQGPGLILFVRGSHDAFSVKQLQLLQKNIPQFNALGVRLLAISPEPLGNLQFAQQQYGIGYPLLNDVNAQVARSFGLSAANGDVTPALVTVDQAGKIVAVQLQSQGTKVFDLSEATASIRSQPQDVSAVPAQDVKPTTPETAVPTTLVAPKEQVPAAMPPVPSPQAGNVSFQLPPSHPDFSKVKADQALGI